MSEVAMFVAGLCLVIFRKQFADLNRSGFEFWGVPFDEAKQQRQAVAVGMVFMALACASCLAHAGGSTLF